jgi:hypothetical protein
VWNFQDVNLKLNCPYHEYVLHFYLSKTPKITPRR